MLLAIYYEFKKYYLNENQIMIRHKELEITNVYHV